MGKGKKFFMYLILSIASIVSVFPLYYMFCASTNKSVDVIAGKLIPGTYLIENYKALIGVQGFQLFKDFNRYTAATYKKLINLFVSGINRIKKGEKGYAVLTDCLTASGIILKEDF